MRFIFSLILFVSQQLYAHEPPASHLYPIIWKWLKGKADSSYTFTETSHPGLVKNIRDAFQVRRAREFWYNKNLDSFQQGNFNWLPVSDFLGRFHTVKGVCRSGFDMVEQILGGFTVHVQPISRDSVKFKVYDIKSRWSLFFHLPFVKNIAFDRTKTHQKPMTNTELTIEWTEAVSTRLFYQRKLNLLQIPNRQYSGHNF